MDIIKVSDINGAVISKNLLYSRYHKGRYFADAKITLQLLEAWILILLITVLIMVGIFIKIMTKIDL
jgi:hypothetical protein